ncbi:IreB family regulatory phosphoprotein [Wansuia hejianensis]|uniref:UPF0297 protein H8689_05940 n=1 Tax=Wansuia hejianensis TaxID=2763667 RepID=A0A926F028_9FIRM|nr:IreB family regulatory phosphoprotein [Wansuia hejianensis]MBC8590672.1 IreB family regulatory phosphoprotein [Wansuia hejianensis]
MDKNNGETMMFEMPKDNLNEPKEIILYVYEALKERDYDPINQIIGYILSGDPTYITSYKDARSIVRKLERDELLEEILRKYLEHIEK